MKQEEETESKILCRFIIEMLGAPEKHIVSTLKDYVANLKHREDMEIIAVEISEAKQQEELFSVFAEVEAKLKDIPTLMGFCFDALPSSIEIIEPDYLKFKSSSFSGLLNDLMAKLHQLDMSIKNLDSENKAIRIDANRILSNLLVVVSSTGPKDLNFLSKISGVNKDILESFLEHLIKTKKMMKDGDKYVVYEEKNQEVSEQKESKSD